MTTMRVEDTSRDNLHVKRFLEHVNSSLFYLKMLTIMLSGVMFVKGMRGMTSAWRCHSMCPYL